MKMLHDCHKYARAINAKGEAFPSEPLIMALLLLQHKIIEWLTDKITRQVRLIIELAPRQSSPDSDPNPGNLENAESNGHK
jgi:hypothetical protein